MKCSEKIVSETGGKVVAVRAGKRPEDVLSMTYAQHALIGSGGYFPEDVRDVMEMTAQVDKALNVVIRY